MDSVTRAVSCSIAGPRVSSAAAATTVTEVRRSRHAATILIAIPPACLTRPQPPRELFSCELDWLCDSVRRTLKNGYTADTGAMQNKHQCFKYCTSYSN